MYEVDRAAASRADRCTHHHEIRKLISPVCELVPICNAGQGHDLALTYLDGRASVRWTPARQTQPKHEAHVRRLKAEDEAEAIAELEELLPLLAVVQHGRAAAPPATSSTLLDSVRELRNAVDRDGAVLSCVRLVQARSKALIEAAADPRGAGSRRLQPWCAWRRWPPHIAALLRRSGRTCGSCLKAAVRDDVAVLADQRRSVCAMALHVCSGGVPGRDRESEQRRGARCR